MAKAKKRTHKSAKAGISKRRKLQGISARSKANADVSVVPAISTAGSGISER